MKTLRNIYNSNLYNTFNSLPKNPKIVLFGTLNVDKSLFAHRLAIDAKIPVISIQKFLILLFLSKTTILHIHFTEKF